MKKIPLYTLALVLSLIFSTPAHSMEDVVKVLEAEPASRNPEDPGLTHSITISNPDLSFLINYLTAKDGTTEVGDPSVAGLSINNLYTAPSFSFNVTAPNFSLARKPFTVEILKGNSEKKGIKAQWQLPEGEVELLLVLNEADPMLYGRLKVSVAGKARIGINLAPGGFTTESETRDRWVHTPGAEDQPHGEATLAMKPEGWLLLYDTILDPASSEGKGAAGFIWKMDGDAQVNFRCGDYVSSFALEMAVDGGERTLDFAFRPFEGLPNDAAKDIMSSDADAIISKLGTEAPFAFPSTH